MTSDELTPLEDWPKPAVVAEARVFASEYELHLCYSTADERIAIIAFRHLVFKFGYPNDEALKGHPLAKKGLDYYCAYRVEDSTWLRALEGQNAIHPRHDPARFVRGTAPWRRTKA